MDKLPDTICMLPWISIEASPMGTARPCCLAREDIADINLTVHTLEDAYRSTYMQNLRQQFRKGEKPLTCKLCWDEEAAGRNSKRINSRIRLKELYPEVDWSNDTPDQLWFLDLKLGNICNLKCRICGSWSSSKWAEEEMNYLPPTVDKKQHIAYKWLRQGAWPRNSVSFWNNLKILLPNIQYIEFTGGEPWLIEEHIQLLKFAVEQDLANKIEIHYNTNGTQWSDELSDIWSHFRRVDIAFSIDNVGQRFEYERYGANWEQVLLNLETVGVLKQYKRNVTTQLCFTVNVQNVYYLDELLRWADTQAFDTIYFNMLHSPDHMSIQQMTEAAQKLVLDKLQSVNWWNNFYAQEIRNVINFIKNGTGSDGVSFLKKMQRTDQYRKQNFVHTHPEIARAMGYE